MKPTTIAIIGVGKISQDQHLPVIAKDPNFKLAGLVSQRGLQQPGVPTFRTPAELYAALPDLDAVAICTPPSVRHAIAREALDAGKHVLLEKPPTPTMAEFHDLAAHAAARRRVIFATWHSQYNSAVDEAKKRLAGRRAALAAYRMERGCPALASRPGMDLGRRAISAYSIPASTLCRS